MKQRKSIALFLMIFMLVSLFTGCADSAGSEAAPAADQPAETSEPAAQPEAEEPVTITMWHTYSDGETEVFENEVIPAFEASHPNIKVEATRMPYDGLKQQVIAGVSSATAPDVMRMDIIWVPEFAKLGALEKVSAFDGFDTIKANVFEGPMSTNYYDGDYYGLPLNTNTKIAIYNKALLAELGVEVPKTMDELVAIAETLKDRDDTWGIGVGGAGTWGMLPYFWTMGGSVTDDNYTVASGYLNSPESVKALDTIAGWYRDGIVGPCIIGEQPDTWGGMGNGNYFMIEDGPWYYSIIGDDALNNTVNAVMPAGPGGSISVVGGEDMVMFKTSENKEAAWIFMQWMLSPEPQIMMAQMGLVPTNMDAAKDEQVLDSPYIGTYIEQLKTAQPRTPSPKWESMSETIATAFELVIRGEQDAKTALDEAAAICDELLQ